MTTEHEVMRFLERADPVRSGDAVTPPMSARRYLETRVQQRSTAMTVLERTTETTEPSRPRWPLYAAAAAVVAIVIASIAVIVATSGDGDDMVPATVPITTPETLPPAEPTEGAQSAVADLVATYNTGDTDAVLALMSDDVIMTKNYGGGGPNPDDEPEGRDGIELDFAWNNAQGEQWTELVCERADEQRPAGTMLECTWDTLDAVVLAADQPVIPTRALIVVVDDVIAELHLGYSYPDFAATARNYNSWMESRHPAEADIAGCCSGSTREESVERGKARAEWAERWAAFRDTYGCVGAATCTISSPEWTAQYEALCAADAVLSAEAVDQMRALPQVFGRGSSGEALLAADEALLTPGLADDQVAALQRDRLDAMAELGIDESCHPAIG
jgi:hypothetical protein